MIKTRGLTQRESLMMYDQWPMIFLTSRDPKTQGLGGRGLLKAPAMKSVSPASDPS